jgi:hypothetical protein
MTISSLRFNRIPVLGSLTICLAGCDPGLNPPRDQDVRALFAARRPDFEKVRDMILADSISAVQLSPDGPKAFSHGSGWFGLSGRPSPRHEEYMRILRRLGVSRVDRGWHRPDGDVAFTVYRFGNVADSYTKSIVFSQNTPTPLRSDTDTPEFNRDNTVVYSQIDEGWYIEKERD